MTTASNTKKILVVDDDIALTKLLGGILTNHGYKVSTAYDGLEGMVQVGRNTPDLIILDIMMPGLNGYDVCKELKFNTEYKHIPIIVLTSREQELSPRIGQLMGIDYMHKPLDSKLLLEKVQKALSLNPIPDQQAKDR
jgi:DNA-binding response OmpR family regulator